jgi:hypothetical protein
MRRLGVARTYHGNEPLRIACIDVGSALSTGWASELVERAESQRQGADIQDLLPIIQSHLNAAGPVALGFECPLYVPVRTELSQLNRGRLGEGSPAWSSSIGATVMASGIPLVLWVLERLKEAAPAAATATVDWLAFLRAPSGILLWEAFVTGPAKAGSHAADAAAAIRTFTDHLPRLRADKGPPQEPHVQSLVGAALLRTGWSTDLSLLARPCLMLKTLSAAATPYPS